MKSADCIHTLALHPPSCPLRASGWLIETQGVWYVERQRCLSLVADNQGYSYRYQTVSSTQAIFLELQTGLEVILTFPARAERQHRVERDCKLIYSQRWAEAAPNHWLGLSFAFCPLMVLRIKGAEIDLCWHSKATSAEGLKLEPEAETEQTTAPHWPLHKELKSKLLSSREARLANVVLMDL